MEDFATEDVVKALEGVAQPSQRAIGDLDKVGAVSSSLSPVHTAT